MGTLQNYSQQSLLPSLHCYSHDMCALGDALTAMAVKGVGSQTLYTTLKVSIFVAFLLTLLCLIIFIANVIQFGADQLNEYPSDRNLSIGTFRVHMLEQLYYKLY